MFMLKRANPNLSFVFSVSSMSGSNGPSHRKRIDGLVDDMEKQQQLLNSTARLCLQTSHRQQSDTTRRSLVCFVKADLRLSILDRWHTWNKNAKLPPAERPTPPPPPLREQIGNLLCTYLLEQAEMHEIPPGVREGMVLRANTLPPRLGMVLRSHFGSSGRFLVSECHRISVDFKVVWVYRTSIPFDQFPSDILFKSEMASTSRSTGAATAAAGAAALLGGASFVSAPTSGSSANLRATAASNASAAPRLEASASTKTVSLAMAGAAMAALTAGGRKALVTVKPQLVTMMAFENELGVQAHVGFWDPAGKLCGVLVLAFGNKKFRIFAGHIDADLLEREDSNNIADFSTKHTSTEIFPLLVFSVFFCSAPECSMLTLVVKVYHLFEHT